MNQQGKPARMFSVEEWSLSSADMGYSIERNAEVWARHPRSIQPFMKEFFGHRYASEWLPELGSEIACAVFEFNLDPFYLHRFLELFEKVKAENREKPGPIEWVEGDFLAPGFAGESGESGTGC